MKTPKQIARDILSEKGGPAPGSHPALIDMMVAAIEADQAQREYPIIVAEDANSMTRTRVMSPGDAYDVISGHFEAGYMRHEMRWEQ